MLKFCKNTLRHHLCPYLVHQSHVNISLWKLNYIRNLFGTKRHVSRSDYLGKMPISWTFGYTFFYFDCRNQYLLSFNYTLFVRVLCNGYDIFQKGKITFSVLFFMQKKCSPLFLCTLSKVRFVLFLKMMYGIYDFNTWH